ncbi:hypothetical protein CPT03_18070 [Pedobacter ginsengisoli]|uniref:Carboxypeptidase-like regulatory domain-containing protein n=1 Tax=Pedobacter ginsengisoli TaxID=363852 RepID=A0A2D1U9H6_9SPHI|nr:hypothetical protein [Pedobacter ginsengisoli]ATP58232.1 hypothetical protein CPT03_18070 [Pedobacter ginsengisoli]
MKRPGYLNILIFLLFFVASVSSVSAQQEVILKGAVIEKGTSTRVAAAQVINKRLGISVVSSDFGLFQIKAVPGDTLLVVKIEYSDAEAVVPAGKDLIVYLDRGRTLKEVNITGQTKKQELNDIKRDFKNKGAFYQGKPPFLSFLFKPLTAVYELFGRTPKNARRFGRYYETEMQQTLIDGFFNEIIIQNNTDLKGESLEKYMMDYRPEYEKAKNWTEYDAVKYIRESYKKYTDTLKK